MDRCLQCNSTLKPEEKECFTCGATVPEKNAKKSLPERFQLVVKILFLAFAGLTAASLVLPAEYCPSFYKCAGGFAIILLVKNSIDNMVESKKG